MNLQINPQEPALTNDVTLRCLSPHSLVFYYGYYDKHEKGNKETLAYLDSVLKRMRCFNCGALMARLKETKNGIQIFENHEGRNMINPFGEWRDIQTIPEKELEKIFLDKEFFSVSNILNKP